MISRNPVYIWRQNSKRSELLGVKGKLLSFTMVRVKPKQMASVGAYCVGMIDIGERKVMARLCDVDSGSVTKGQVLVGRLRRMQPPDKSSPIYYGVAFGPLREEA